MISTIQLFNDAANRLFYIALNGTMGANNVSEKT
jgi:hypothetical protein